MTGCTAFTDNATLGEASFYFKMFPSEPIKEGSVVDINKIIPMTNVFDLMKTIITTNTKDILLACHVTFNNQGDPTGLRIPLLRDVPQVFLEENGFELLEPGNNKRPKGQEIAKKLGIKSSVLKVMQKNAEDVREKRLNRIIIRGCQIGLSSHVLRRIKDVFGCRYICAPTKNMFFGKLPIHAKEGSVNMDERHKWLENHPLAVREESIAWQVQQTLQFHLTIDMWADSPEAATNWVRKHFGTGRFSYGSPLFWEGIRSEQLVFPNDPGYREYLQIG